jgi:hypothetical protein
MSIKKVIWIAFLKRPAICSWRIHKVKNSAFDLHPIPLALRRLKIRLVIMHILC